MFVLFLGLSSCSKRPLCWESSGCRPDALCDLSYAVVVPSTLSSMLTLLRLISSHKLVYVIMYRV